MRIARHEQHAASSDSLVRRPIYGSRLNRKCINALTRPCLKISAETGHGLDVQPTLGLPQVSQAGRVCWDFGAGCGLGPADGRGRGRARSV